TVITGLTTTSVAPTQDAGRIVGALPQPRSDASAVTIGNRTFVVGGYDGQHGDQAVLATTDGTHFTAVAQLPTPVRYGAVVADAGRIYVFGGEATDGAQAGRPIDAIQVIDPRAGTA